MLFRSKSLAAITLERLQAYRWPGNVRELVNLCRRLTALAPGSEIHLEDLPSEMHIVTPAAQTDWAAALTLWAKAQPHDGTVAWLDQALPEFERVLIRVALNRTHGPGKDGPPFEEPPEIGCQFVGSRVAPGRFFAQAFQTDRFEIARQVGVQPRRRHRLLAQRLQDGVERRLGAERRPARE